MATRVLRSIVVVAVLMMVLVPVSQSAGATRVDQYSASRVWSPQSEAGGPQDAELYADRAKLALAAEQFADAIADLNMAIDLDDGNPDYYFLRGVAYASAATAGQPEGDFEAALGDLSMAIEINPEAVPYYATRAAVYYDRGELDLAAQDYSAARDLNYDYARYIADEYFFAGKRAHADGKLALAIRNYSQAIGLDPFSPINFRLRGMAYREAADAQDPIGDYTLALADLNAGIQLCYTKEFLCWLERGMLHGERGRTYSDAALSRHWTGDYGRAITDFYVAVGNAVLTQSREDEITGVEHFLHSRASSLALRGLTYYRAALAGHPVGSLTKALADLTRAIRLDPDYIKFYQWRGDVYRSLGDMDDARADHRRPYDTAVGPEPQDSYFYFQQAADYESRGRYREALSNLDQAIELAPEDGGAFARRGSLYVALAYSGSRLGDIEQGMHDLTRAIELEPGDDSHYFARAAGYSVLLTEDSSDDIYWAIIGDLTQAIRLQPYDGKYYRERGRAYRAIGQIELAEVDFAKAREFDYLD